MCGNMQASHYPAVDVAIDRMLLCERQQQFSWEALPWKQISFVPQIGQLKVDESNYPYSTAGDVTILQRSTDKTTVAGGYSTGELRIFNYITKEVVATFRGHRSAVSAVAFERSGSIVASGGRDSDIFLWDLVTLTGEVALLTTMGWTAHVDDCTLQ